MFSFFKKKQKERLEIKNSIYQCISEKLDNNGSLPHGFSLPDNTTENQIKFAPGAMDGMGIYHMTSGDQTEIIDKFIPILEKAFENADVQSEKIIISFINENRVLRLIDPLSERLRSGETKITPNNLLTTAYRWATESSDIELTKLGLALLGLLDIENDDKYRKVILTLGKCDEFTLYSLVAISGWNDGNDLTFDFARHTHGWGKIHSVERLIPQTNEIKDWILKYGCSNGVVDAYLGLTCAEKGDMITALRQNEIDPLLFNGISVIIEALLDEGPTAGISAYEYADESIKLYLKHAEKHCNSAKLLNTILNIKEHFKNKNVNMDNEIVIICDKIINKEGWETIVTKAVNSDNKSEFFSAWSVSNKLNFDIYKPLYHYLEKYPLENGFFICTLLKSSEYRDKAINLYEKKLPVNEIASGMGNSLGLGKEYEPHRCLSSILQALQPYPLLGLNFIETGLSSPVVNNRNGACAVLEAWQITLNQSVNEFAPKMAEQIRNLMKIEVDETLKLRYVKLV